MMQLYKFSAISPRSIAAAATGKLYAATLQRMNDPFEDRFDGATGSLSAIVKSCGVVSVSRSEPGPDDVLTSPLMWAHYASNHTGIAVGLEPSKNHPPFDAVEYLSDDELNRQLQELQRHYDERTHSNAQSLVRMAFKYKTDFWSYENEYRRIYIVGNRYVDPLARINEVVFGFRARPEEELAVWSALRDTVRYRKSVNRNGQLVVEDYEPPHDINAGPEKLLLPDHPDGDIEHLEEDKLTDPPRAVFVN